VRRIGLVTEETADLPLDIVNEYGIEIINALLDWPEIEKLPGSNTFQKMRELEKRGIKSFGRTSQPKPQDFLDKYEYILKESDSVLCITLTAKLSGSHNSAILAREMLEPNHRNRVYIVDSLSASCGQALVVLRAIDLIENGESIEDIVKELNTFVHKVYFYVMFEDPKWLEASGRISSFVANLMRGMARMKVRPILKFRNGVLSPAGLKTKAEKIPEVLCRQLLRDTEKIRGEGHRIRLAITHGDDIEGAQMLKTMAKEKFEEIEVPFINIINNVVGAPTGPNTIALAWCEI